MGPFEEAGRKAIEGAKAGMDQVATEIMTDSLIECPIDTGALRSTAKAEPAENTGTRLVARMGYGYGDTINPKTRKPVSEYAVPVHEETEVAHALPTKAKYLEDPLFLHAGAYGPTLAAYIRAYLGEAGLYRIGTLTPGGAATSRVIAAPFPGPTL